MIDQAFWNGRRVFLTGHTGFKGAWMVLLLRSLGAEVRGFALPPDHKQGLFEIARVADDVDHRIGDIRDPAALEAALAEAKPSLVIHMAAQSLVRMSYDAPVETYATNIMGTVHLLDAVRRTTGIRAVVVVTSDKCYENRGVARGFREADAMGGHDPYSSSKGCAELVTAAYRDSFFHAPGSVRVASARAGNVIGGGDWARDRLVPDMMRSFMDDNVVRIRSPSAIRPWQHVLDPLLGYLKLAQHLVGGSDGVAEGWNFGPGEESEVPVSTLVEQLARRWGPRARWQLDEGEHPHEAAYLKLDCSKARTRLGWRPLVGLDLALQMTCDWYLALAEGKDMRQVSTRQIESVMEKALHHA
ncbi:CDP-glucose 4,6-dehydratase [Bradyrhizobium lablabi]|uniref:CDP-glucose 4,6-dehydratase n=1 Tax=Bradyrhizobium lablabi TaxID=722472 RepID=A0A1M7BDF0_9BRAD|nr:CDP-glucose 4,6-dehydratase [Bradyrhizobium lablabi]SHL53032.1 CDP-glucose 4,6-dehydratase [Bradyrhizobium lablabi]